MNVLEKWELRTLSIQIVQIQIWTIKFQFSTFKTAEFEDKTWRASDCRWDCRVLSVRRLTELWAECKVLRNWEVLETAELASTLVRCVLCRRQKSFRSMTSMVTIFGYGSLMSYSSVLSTMPSALNFRPASLADYSRSFNLVSISGIKSGMLGYKACNVFHWGGQQLTIIFVQVTDIVCTLGTADTSTSEMAALSIRKVEASSGHKSLIRGCIFDIPSIELEPYLEREHRYIPFQTEVIDHQVQFAVHVFPIFSSEPR